MRSVSDHLCVVRGTITPNVAATTFYYFLDMKRRLDGIFHLSNSHVVVHVESKKMVLEALDSEKKQGLCLFVLQNNEFSLEGQVPSLFGLSMDSWRTMSELAKHTTNRRNLLLRVEFPTPSTIKFGLHNTESEEYSYVVDNLEGGLPSAYKDDRKLEPGIWDGKITFKCPLEFERICKDACVVGDTIRLFVVEDFGAIQLVTEGPHGTNITFTIPTCKDLEVEGTKTSSKLASSLLPLRILRIVGRFCTRVDCLVFYLMEGRGMVMVAKKKRNIAWSLRFRL